MKRKTLKAMTVTEVTIAIVILVTAFVMAYTAFSQSGRYLSRGIDYSELDDTASALLTDTCDMIRMGRSVSEIENALNARYSTDAAGNTLNYTVYKKDGVLKISSDSAESETNGCYITITLSSENSAEISYTDFIPSYDIISETGD